MRHAAPLSIGLNCALGAKEMRAHIAELGRVADTLVCAYPNAGLPNEFGRYDETPGIHGGADRRVRRRPAWSISSAAAAAPRRSISARIAEAVAGKAPRPIPEIARAAAALRPRAFTLTPEIPFVNVGERTNVTGSARFRKLDHQRRLSGRARCRARSGRERRADHRRQHGRRPARFREGDGDLPQSRRRRAGHRARAGDGRFLEILRHRGRAEMRPGQAGGELDLA